VHTRVVENSVKLVQGVHLNFVSISRRACQAGTPESLSNSEEKNCASESTPELPNTLRKEGLQGVH
jgi:hypothetical protein